MWSLSVRLPCPKPGADAAIAMPFPQAAWEKRKELWQSAINPFMQSLATICPSVVMLASEVESIVNSPDAFPAPRASARDAPCDPSPAPAS